MESETWTLPEERKISIIEPDWKMLFGALAVKVSAASAYDGEQREKHLKAAMEIIENAFSWPLFISEGHERS